MPITRLDRKLFEATGSGGTTVDVAKPVSDKNNTLVTYGGAIVDVADYDLTQNTPAAGSTRFTFAFTLLSGEKIKIYA